MNFPAGLTGFGQRFLSGLGSGIGLADSSLGDSLRRRGQVRRTLHLGSMVGITPLLLRHRAVLPLRVCKIIVAKRWF